MTEVGKSLVFCLKYYPEMESLDGEAKTPISKALPGHPHSASIKEKIDRIRNSAGKEAADLIHLCADAWLHDLKSTTGMELRSPKRAATEKRWGLEVTLGSKPSTHQIGIWINQEGLTPWVWCRGGQAVEKNIQRLFGRVETFGSKAREATSGAVALKTTKIDWNSAKDFTLDAAPIVERTKKTLKAINPEFIAKFRLL
mgnify:CR=1 FL=1